MSGRAPVPPPATERAGSAGGLPGRGVGRRLALSWLLALGATGCGGETPPLLVGSTTSLDDTGLLDEVLPAFEATHGRRVRVIAVGTGEALELARRGDVDVVIVHAPAAELEFVRQGHGRGRVPFLRNDFVIAGPREDPAGAGGREAAAAAMAALARSGAPFVSRGDESGTHLRERELWRQAGVEPAGPWYTEVGQGMAAALQVAGERRAYILTDRATLVTAGRGLDLAVLVEGDSLLANVYSVIEVTGAADPEGAREFARWISSAESIGRMAAFGRDRYGTALFTPVTPERDTAATAAR